MAYPPALPPSTRTDATLMAGAHSSDHNVLAQALADFLAELGADPSGAYADLTSRLADLDLDATAQATTSAATMHVAENGSDAATGLTPGRAKATIQAAHDALPAEGGVITLAAGSALTVGTTTTITKRITLVGNGARLIAALPASPHLLRLEAGATGSTFTDLRLEGAATGEGIQFGIFTDAASVPNNITISRCAFTGLNDGIKIETGGADWLITGNHFEDLVGVASGAGYGVLAGGAVRARVTANKFVGTPGKGRHAVYFSAGCVSCVASNNTVDGFNEAALAVYSLAHQPTSEGNALLYNIVTGCALNGSPDSGAIEIVGDATRNIVAGNIVKSSGSHGIIVTDSGQGGLTIRNEVRGNSVTDSAKSGIQIIGAKSTLVQGNRCHNNGNLAGGGVQSGIRVDSTGTFGGQVADDTWIIGNVSDGPMQRHAIDVNDSAPVPTGTIVKGNILGAGQSGTLNYATAVIVDAENTLV